jgi:hypothetical protein
LRLGGDLRGRGLRKPVAGGLSRMPPALKGKSARVRTAHGRRAKTVVFI